MEILDQLIHELRSPLSLVLIKAEASGDKALERCALRMDWLMRYAAAAAGQVAELAEVPLRESVLAAADVLSQSWEQLRVSADGIDEQAAAVLPEDEEQRLVLLCAWLETALYGTGCAELQVEASTMAMVVLVEASAVGGASRGLANVRMRLCTRAAAQLAGAVGGRLIVSATLPQATLVLRRSAMRGGDATGQRRAA